MTYDTLYEEFERHIPEVVVFCERDAVRADMRLDDGPHIKFDTIVSAYLIHLKEAGEEEQIQRCMQFFDKMVASEDKECGAVFDFSVMESIVGAGLYLCFEPYMTKTLKKSYTLVAQYIATPQDEPKK